MSRTRILDFLGCVFGAILLVILINTISDMFFFADRNGSTQVAHQAVEPPATVEAKVAPELTEATVEPVIEAATAIVVAAVGSADAGVKIFKKCKSCHSFAEGGKHKTGPNLFGVVGRTAGVVEGFKFSPNMKNSGLTWDEATLDKFLISPKKLIAKTKMSFPGLKKETQRADLIAYLGTLQ